MKDAFNNIANKVRHKNGGRPKKKDNERRKNNISSAYTDEEAYKIDELAKAACMSRSVYQRQAALESTVIAKNIKSGQRIYILQKIFTQLRYCRAELHKMNKDPSAPAITESLARVEELMAVATIALRKEIGLDPR